MTIKLKRTPQLECYISWLHDAYAMEQQAETMLLNFKSRLTHYPTLQSRTQQHIISTTQQQLFIKGIINHYDIATSTLKKLTGKITAVFQNISTILTSDEIVKDIMCGYAFEQFEIACYQTLIAAADQLAAEQDKIIFQQILAEEKAMANWLWHNTAQITQQFLMHSGTPK